MTAKDMIRTPTTGYSPPATPAALAAPAAIIERKLDKIVEKSRRRSRLRRMLSGAGNVFARWLDSAVSRTTPLDGNDLPPQIRFPFF
jgi:hypothetical protein